MIDRRFTEVDLRKMLQIAGQHRKDVVEYRWVVETRHEGRDWEVIVEPDQEAKLDLDRDGVPVGIEITAPRQTSLTTLNEVLRKYELPEVTQADLGPLLAA